MMSSLFAATYGPAEDIEVLWTLLGLLGGLFSIWNLRSARGDVRFLEEAGVENGRMFLAKATRLAEWTRLVKQAMIVATGALALCITSPDPGDLYDDPVRFALSVVFRWGFVVFAALVTFQSLLAWEVRREFERGFQLAVKDAELIQEAHVQEIENGSDRRDA